VISVWCWARCAERCYPPRRLSGRLLRGGLGLRDRVVRTGPARWRSPGSWSPGCADGRRLASFAGALVSCVRASGHRHVCRRPNRPGRTARRPAPPASAQRGSRSRSASSPRAAGPRSGAQRPQRLDLTEGMVRPARRSPWPRARGGSPSSAASCNRAVLGEGVVAAAVGLFGASRTRRSLPPCWCAVPRRPFARTRAASSGRRALAARTPPWLLRSCSASWRAGGWLLVHWVWMRFQSSVARRTRRSAFALAGGFLGGQGLHRLGPPGGHGDSKSSRPGCGPPRRPRPP